MQSHIHLSAISFAVTAAIVVIVEFLIHMAAQVFSTSPNEQIRLFGGAFANLA